MQLHGTDSSQVQKWSDLLHHLEPQHMTRHCRPSMTVCVSQPLGLVAWKWSNAQSQIMPVYYFLCKKKFQRFSMIFIKLDV